MVVLELYQRSKLTRLKSLQKVSIYRIYKSGCNKQIKVKIELEFVE